MSCHASTIACTVRSCTSLRYDVGTPPQTPAVSAPPCEWSESTTIWEAVGAGEGLACLASTTGFTPSGHAGEVAPAPSAVMQAAASLRISFSPKGPCLYAEK